jgi:endonuclease YncB( thermonuclease family)
VVWVYDGDTVKLEDGEKVRLIGLNAPELGHDGQPSQAYARAATRALEQSLETQDHRVLLRYGAERKDHYGRSLAHVFLADQTSLSEQLLRQGLALRITVPPNDWNLDCYREAEAEARTRRKGLWSLPAYRVTPSTQLDRQVRGFRIVSGTVQRVGQGRRSVWLNLDGDLALRIERTDLGNLPISELVELKGEQVIARGWLYTRRGRLRMRIRHPADLERPPRRLRGEARR